MVIPGLMLDGLNFSGKTTVLRILERLLTDAGETVVYRKCHLSGLPAVDALHERVFDLLPVSPDASFPSRAFMAAFNPAMSALLMLDAALAAGAAWDALLLQDRHWLSQLCNNAFFTPGEDHLPDRWVREAAPRCSLHVYLACSPASRSERSGDHGRRADTHRLNRYLSTHLDRLAEFEESNLRVISSLDHVEVIESDLLDPATIAAHLFDRLLVARREGDQDDAGASQARSPR